MESKPCEHETKRLEKEGATKRGPKLYICPLAVVDERTEW